MKQRQEIGVFLIVWSLTVVPQAGVSEPASIAAGPDLSLEFDSATGMIGSLVCRGKSLRTQGGFRVEDAATGKAAPLLGSVTRAGDLLKLSVEVKELGLKLEATVAAAPHCAEVVGSLRDLTGADRTVRLTFALNLDTIGWNWWDDIRRRRVIEEEKIYLNGTAHSVYPLCCVENGQQAVSLAIPLDRYVTHRFVYDGKAKELRLEFDFGLSPMTKKFPSRADFRFFLFSANPQWGFRAAAERYYQIVPATFATHAKRGGLWMTFHDLEEISYAEDFHFAFHESGCNPAINRRLGVATLHYVIPGQLDVLLPFDAAKGLSLDEIERQIRTDPSYEKLREQLLERILVMRDSVMFNAEGKPYVSTFYANWARGKLVYDCHVNSDPDLPLPHAHAGYMDAALEKVDKDLEAQGLDLEGVYLDNFGGGIPNYRREHWGSVDPPLTFRKAAPGPCAVGGVSEHEYAAHLNRKYWPEGHIVFANGWTMPQLFHTAVLDAGGTETYWATRQERLGSVFDWDRVLMYGKVHCPLLKFDKEEFNALFSRLEDYLAECAFYGFYPSIYTSGGWKYQSFWADPKMYERYREDFRHYVPVVDELQRAGWQPVTRATLSNPELGIERYGRPEDGKFYLTVYNPLAAEAEVTLDSDLQCPGETPVAVDMLHPEVWAALTGDRTSFTTRLRGYECRAFLICPRAAAVQFLRSRAADALHLLAVGEDDPVRQQLAPLADALANSDPGAEPSRMSRFGGQLKALAERNTNYHLPGPDRYVALRARECYRWWSTAVALHRRIHLDELLPQEETIVGGEILSCAKAMPEVKAAEARILEAGANEQDTARMPDAPYRRVKTGAFADIAINGADSVPLFVQRSYVTAWGVCLSASSDGKGLIGVKAVNRSSGRLSLRLKGRAPEGFRLVPEDRPFDLEKGEEKSFAYRLEGARGRAETIHMTWVAWDSSGRLVGCVKQAVTPPPAGESIVPKSGFEEWEPPPDNAVLSGSAAVVETNAHSGKACLAAKAESDQEAHSCRWTIPVTGAPPEQVFVSGWSRAEDVSGEQDKDYSIWVGGRTKEGGWAFIGTAQFDTGTHDWQNAAAVFPVPRNVVVFNVWALFRDHSGEAWFDDVIVAPVPPSVSYNPGLEAEIYVDDAPSAAAKLVNDGQCGPESAAYRTGDNPRGHGVELRWKTPIEVSRVVLHWPSGERRPLSSTEFAIQFHDGQDWTYWALGHAYVPEQTSVLTAPPVVTDRLRLIQAPKGGAIDARDRLQLTEIEVF